MNKAAWCQQSWMWIVFCVITIVFVIVITVPLVIDYAYFNGTGGGKPNTSFSESDMLGYCGAILSTLASTAVALLLMRQTWKIAKRQEQINKEIAESQTEMARHQLKVELFDKRHAVYACFEKYRMLLSRYKDFSDEIEINSIKMKKDKLFARYCSTSLSTKSVKS